jgi:hypothetical protein
MSDKPDLKVVRPDADDLAGLWLPTGLGDGLTDTHIYRIPIGKPRDFFQVCPDENYRRKCEVYTHKVEGQIEEETYIIDASMRGEIEEARPCTLVVCIYRDGTVRLWALKLPKDGEKDNEAWKTARAAARTAMGGSGSSWCGSVTPTRHGMHNPATRRILIGASFRPLTSLCSRRAASMGLSATATIRS